MGQKESIVSYIRRAPLVLVPITIFAATAMTGVLIRGNDYSNHVTLLILGASTGLGIYAYWLVSDVNILCIQVDPESETPARNHHFNEFNLEEGYSEFDTFVDIPEWMDEFVLEFNADPPLEIGFWEIPDDYNEKGDTIECSDNAHDFSFVLTVGGDTDKLGTADRKLRIRENKTGTKIDTFIIKSTNSNNDNNYREEYSFDS